MLPMGSNRRWFWLTLALSSVTIAGLIFGMSELIEVLFFRHVDEITLHYMYLSRSVLSSLVLTFWAAWFVLRERRAHELRLRRSNERYRGILETTPGAVVLYDRDLRVREWNASAERLYGYTAEEAVGQPLPPVTVERRPEVGELIRRVQEGRPVLDLETQRQAKDGCLVDVQLSLLPFTEYGETMFLEVTQDIRERIRLRQKLLELEKLTTMGEMAAGTAHHLNTPLAAMLLRMRMVRERVTDAEVTSDLEQLETSLRFCQQFVRRLLDFSRRPEIEKRAEPLRATLESVISFLSPQLLEKRIRFHAVLEGLDGIKVITDRNQMEALFLVFLSNAVDAVVSGGEVTIACSRVPDERVELRITDNGCGIEGSDLEHIFEPFFTTKPPGKGTGLGLALARNILREHGGAVRFESARGQGTTVYVVLPTCAEVVAGANS
ncbi:MAG: PAS domain S-box protein [Acidobacteriia bacterium]|nr:PAS domain S-box protein [Terriglobia bacterium]